MEARGGGERKPLFRLVCGAPFPSCGKVLRVRARKARPLSSAGNVPRREQFGQGTSSSCEELRSHNEAYYLNV